MEHVSPFDTDKPILLLSSLYPFIRGDSGADFQRARVNLKIACLLHNSCTIPGSMALLNPFVRSLLLSNEEVLKSGAVVLDMRCGYGSFADMANDKLQKHSDDSIKRHAEKFDTLCPNVLSFDPESTSNLYIEAMRGYLTALRERSRKETVQVSLDKGLLRLDQVKETLTLQDAMSLVHDSYLEPKVQRAAKLFYCTIGADVTNSIPVIPEYMLDTLNVQPGEIRKVAIGESLRETAYAAAINYFAVSSPAIDRLSAQNIIGMRNESITQQYIQKLDQAIEEAKIQVEKVGQFEKELSKECKSLSEEINRQIIIKCRNEQKQLGMENNTGFLLDTVTGYYIPFLSVIKKGMASLGRLAVKNKKLSWMEKSTTPINSFIEGMHQNIIKS